VEFVGERGTWYAHVGVGDHFALFDLTFRWPKRFTLVATGARTDLHDDGDVKTGRWQSRVPFAVAGFNLGEYKMETAAGDHPKVELYANQQLENAILALLQKNPAALSRAYVGKGIFIPRRTDQGKAIDFMLITRRDYESGGGHFSEYDHPVELWNGVWLTGPVPRKYDERNWSGHIQMQSPSGWEEDNLPEDMSLVINTSRGLVTVSGCSHAGIINTLEYARGTIRNAPVHAALGGFHLFQLDDAKLQWTAGKLREFGVENFLGAHCTGIEAVYKIRELAGLDRRHCAVGAVGATFELGKGLDPGSIAR